MPVTKSAIKALRQSQHKAVINKSVRTKARTLLKKARQTPTPETLTAAFQALDKATKRHIFHANTVSRYKSRLAKMATPKTA